MAFTTLGERWTKKVSVVDTPAEVGPGSYVLPSATQQEPSCAPFNSSSERASPSRKPRVQEDWPAPGSYDPKPPKAYDSGLPRKYVPFACGAERSRALKPRDVEPGPGQYYSYKNHSTQTCKTMGIPQSEKPAVLRSASAPSIPNCKSHHFYEEVGDGRLIKKGAEEGGGSFTGEIGDSVGPGHYGGHLVSSHLPRPRGGKFLGSSRPERVTEAPGPGHYELPETLAQQTPIVSSFVSATVARSEPVKKKKRQDSTPGPGQYYNGSWSTPNLRDADFQYFGSTSERFKAVPDNGCPGPGTYVARQRVVLKSDWSGTDRFPNAKRVDQPGPGAYQAAELPARVSASLLGNTGRLAFGTMESKRGMASGNQDAPGPGAYYEGVPGQDAGNNATNKEPRVRKSVVPMSSFRSATQRDMVKADVSMPPPGAYTPPHIHDVAPVLRVPPRGEGFGSRSTRASHSKAGAAPGPGTYAAEPWKITGGKRAGTFNRTAVEGVPESGKPRGLGFESQASRFQKNPHAERMPGPGYYRVDKEWTKKNYNILYGDI